MVNNAWSVAYGIRKDRIFGRRGAVQIYQYHEVCAGKYGQKPMIERAQGFPELIIDPESRLFLRDSLTALAHEPNQSHVDVRKHACLLR